MDLSSTKETKKGTYWNCSKYGYYIRNYRGQSIIPPKHIKKLKGIKSKKEFKGTQEYTVKHFAFYYNNAY